MEGMLVGLAGLRVRRPGLRVQTVVRAQALGRRRAQAETVQKESQRKRISGWMICG